MASEPRDENTTLHEERAEVASGRRLWLLVLAEGHSGTFPLPDEGAVTIGRSAGCDVRIDVPSISRRHAILHVGDSLRLEDLGSANGTQVRGVTLAAEETVPVAPGDPIELGSTMMVVQQRDTTSRPRRLWTHGYFEGRLEDECARTERGGGRFAVVRLRVRGSGDRHAAGKSILEMLRPGDILAVYGPNEYEALLVDADAEAASRVLGPIDLRLRREGLALDTGVALHPRDGRSPEALLSKACAALDGRSGDAEDRVIVDPAVLRLERLAERVAAGTISVLLLGETGVGKELFAAKIHSASPRAGKPYVRLNCAALTETLAESELFGHEKGAFTGAATAKTGLLEAADGGTIFLDEVGDLPLTIQAKLLRVIEDRELLRVGAVKPRPVDVRFVAATNRDLEAEVARGTFRKDLFYRLGAATLMIPPLRERVVEIAPLARAFVERAGKSLGIPPPPISPEAMALLEGYGWPGNVRELRNTMERAVLLAGGETIGPEVLPLEKMWAALPAAEPATDALEEADEPEPAESPADLRSRRTAYERQVIIDAIARAGGNQTEAARLLGIARRTLITRMEAYGLPRPRKGKPKP